MDCPNRKIITLVEWEAVKDEEVEEEKYDHVIEEQDESQEKVMEEAGESEMAVLRRALSGLKTKEEQ